MASLCTPLLLGQIHELVFPEQQVSAESLNSLARTLRDLTAEAETLLLEVKEAVSGAQVLRAQSTGAADLIGSKQEIPDCSRAHSQQGVRRAGDISAVPALEARATAAVEGGTLLQVLLKLFSCCAFDMIRRRCNCVVLKEFLKPPMAVLQGRSKRKVHVVVSPMVRAPCDHLLFHFNKFSSIAIAELRALDFSRYNQRYIAMEVMYIGWGYLGFASQPTEPRTIEA